MHSSAEMLSVTASSCCWPAGLTRGASHCDMEASRAQFHRIISFCSLCISASVEELHALSHMTPLAQRPARVILGLDLYQAKTLRAGLGKRPPSCTEAFLTEDTWEAALIEKEDSRVYQASGTLQRIRKRRLAPAAVPLTTRLLVALYGVTTTTVTEVQAIMARMHLACQKDGVSSRIVDREGIIDCSQPETALVSESLARRIGLAQFLQKQGAVPAAAAGNIACIIDQLVYSEWGPSAQRRPPLAVVAEGGFTQRPPSGLAGQPDITRVAATAHALTQHLEASNRDYSTGGLDLRESDDDCSVAGSVFSTGMLTGMATGGPHSRRARRRDTKGKRSYSTLATRSGFPSAQQVNAADDPWVAAMYAQPAPPVPPPTTTGGPLTGAHQRPPALVLPQSAPTPGKKLASPPLLAAPAPMKPPSNAPSLRAAGTVVMLADDKQAKRSARQHKRAQRKAAKLGVEILSPTNTGATQQNSVEEGRGGDFARGGGDTMSPSRQTGALTRLLEEQLQLDADMARHTVDEWASARHVSVDTVGNVGGAVGQDPLAPLSQAQKDFITMLPGASIPRTGTMASPLLVGKFASKPRQAGLHSTSVDTSGAAMGRGLSMHLPVTQTVSALELLHLQADVRETEGGKLAEAPPPRMPQGKAQSPKRSLHKGGISQQLHVAQVTTDGGVLEGKAARQLLHGDKYAAELQRGTTTVAAAMSQAAKREQREQSNKNTIVPPASAAAAMRAAITAHHPFRMSAGGHVQHTSSASTRDFIPQASRMQAHASMGDALRSASARAESSAVENHKQNGLIHGPTIEASDPRHAWHVALPGDAARRQQAKHRLSERQAAAQSMADTMDGNALLDALMHRGSQSSFQPDPPSPPQSEQTQSLAQMQPATRARRGSGPGLPPKHSVSVPKLPLHELQQLEAAPMPSASNTSLAPATNPQIPSPGSLHAGAMTASNPRVAIAQAAAHRAGLSLAEHSSSEHFAAADAIRLGTAELDVQTQNTNSVATLFSAASAGRSRSPLTSRMQRDASAADLVLESAVASAGSGTSAAATVAAGRNMRGMEVEAAQYEADSVNVRGPGAPTKRQQAEATTRAHRGAVRVPDPSTIMAAAAGAAPGTDASAASFSAASTAARAVVSGMVSAPAASARGQARLRETAAAQVSLDFEKQSIRDRETATAEVRRKIMQQGAALTASATNEALAREHAMAVARSAALVGSTLGVDRSRRLQNRMLARKGTTVYAEAAKLALASLEGGAATGSSMRTGFHPASLPTVTSTLAESKHTSETTSRELYIASCIGQNDIPLPSVLRALARPGANMSHWAMGAGGGASLAAALGANSTMLNLDVGNNNLGPDGCMALAAALAANRSLRALDMSGNGMGSAAGCTVLQAAAMHPTLTSLSCTSNSLSDSIAQAVYGAVTATRFEVMPLPPQAAKEPKSPRAAPQAPRLPRVTYTLEQYLTVGLRELDLSFNPVGDSVATALAGALSGTSPYYADLLPKSLPAEPLPARGVSGRASGTNGAPSVPRSLLAKGIALPRAFSTSLRRLNLSWTRLGAAGAKSLFLGLRWNTQLEDLNVGWTSLGESGGFAFAELLACNCSLKTAAAPRCGLSPAVGMMVADALRYNRTLHTLVLDNNPMGAVAASAVLASVRAGRCITQLGLRGTLRTDSGAVGGNARYGPAPGTQDGFAGTITAQMDVQSSEGILRDAISAEQAWQRRGGGRRARRSSGGGGSISLASRQRSISEVSLASAGHDLPAHVGRNFTEDLDTMMDSMSPAMLHSAFDRYLKRHPYVRVEYERYATLQHRRRELRRAGVVAADAWSDDEGDTRSPLTSAAQAGTNDGHTSLFRHTEVPSTGHSRTWNDLDGLRPPRIVTGRHRSSSNPSTGLRSPAGFPGRVDSDLSSAMGSPVALARSPQHRMPLAPHLSTGHTSTRNTSQPKTAKKPDSDEESVDGTGRAGTADGKGENSFLAGVLGSEGDGQLEPHVAHHAAVEWRDPWEGGRMFDSVLPDARYQLFLSDPRDRTIAALLLARLRAGEGTAGAASFTQYEPPQQQKDKVRGVLTSSNGSGKAGAKKDLSVILAQRKQAEMQRAAGHNALSMAELISTSWDLPPAGTLRLKYSTVSALGEGTARGAQRGRRNSAAGLAAGSQGVGAGGDGLRTKGPPEQGTEGKPAEADESVLHLKNFYSECMVSLDLSQPSHRALAKHLLWRGAADTVTKERCDAIALNGHPVALAVDSMAFHSAPMFTSRGALPSAAGGGKAAAAAQGGGGFFAEDPSYLWGGAAGQPPPTSGTHSGASAAQDALLAKIKAASSAIKLVLPQAAENASDKPRSVYVPSVIAHPDKWIHAVPHGILTMTFVSPHLTCLAHHKLNLGNSAERRLARGLLDAAHKPASAYGGGDALRNVQWAGRPLALAKWRQSQRVSLQLAAGGPNAQSSGWKVPKNSFLEFDYLSRQTQVLGGDALLFDLRSAEQRFHAAWVLHLTRVLPAMHAWFAVLDGRVVPVAELQLGRFSSYISAQQAAQAATGSRTSLQMRSKGSRGGSPLHRRRLRAGPLSLSIDASNTSDTPSLPHGAYSAAAMSGIGTSPLDRAHQEREPDPFADATDSLVSQHPSNLNADRAEGGGGSTGQATEVAVLVPPPKTLANVLPCFVLQPGQEQPEKKSLAGPQLPALPNSGELRLFTVQSLALGGGSGDNQGGASQGGGLPQISSETFDLGDLAHRRRLCILRIRMILSALGVGARSWQVVAQMAQGRSHALDAGMTPRAPPRGHGTPASALHGRELAAVDCIPPAMWLVDDARYTQETFVSLSWEDSVPPANHGLTPSKVQAPPAPRRKAFFGPLSDPTSPPSYSAAAPPGYGASQAQTVGSGPQAASQGDTVCVSKLFNPAWSLPTHGQLYVQYQWTRSHVPILPSAVSALCWSVAQQPTDAGKIALLRTVSSLPADLEAVVHNIDKAATRAVKDSGVLRVGGRGTPAHTAGPPGDAKKGKRGVAAAAKLAENRAAALSGRAVAGVTDKKTSSALSGWVRTRITSSGDDNEGGGQDPDGGGGTAPSGATHGRRAVRVRRGSSPTSPPKGEPEVDVAAKLAAQSGLVLPNSPRESTGASEGAAGGPAGSVPATGMKLGDPRKLAGRFAFSCADVVRVMSLFSFSHEKRRAAALLRSQVVDFHNLHGVWDSMQHAADAESHFEPFPFEHARELLEIREVRAKAAALAKKRSAERKAVVSSISHTHDGE